MCLSIVRFGLAMAFALASFAESAEGAPAQPETRTLPNGAAVAPDEGWSADDIKDVFEGIQFIMFSIGVGAALYWFWFQHLSSKELPRIEFDVDINCVGENDAAWIIDVFASVRNLGHAKAELTGLHVALESVVTDRLSANSGLLASTDALMPLFAREWVPAQFVLDAGTQTRRACAAALPKTVNFVIVTAQVRHAKRSEIYDASRLVRLGG